MSQTAIIFAPADALKLPDNLQWTNRFEIHSSSSNRVYTVAQNKKKRHWGCSCMGWIRYKHCRHLREMGIPGDLKPFEALLQ